MFHTDFTQFAADAGDIDTQCIVVNENLIVPQIINNVLPGYNFTAPGK